MTIVKYTRLLPFLFGISAIVPAAARAQPRHLNGDFSVGAYVPVLDLGTAQGFSARVRPGVDVRLAAVIESSNSTAFRIALGLVPATATRVRPTSSCTSDCTERSIATWVVAPGADLLWRVGAARPLYLATGAGFSMYARTTQDCVDFVGRFCPSSFLFTKNAIRPSGRLGIGYGGNTTQRLMLEVDDYLTPITGGQLQNDLRIALGARF